MVPKSRELDGLPGPKKHKCQKNKNQPSTEKPVTTPWLNFTERENFRIREELSIIQRQKWRCPAITKERITVIRLRSRITESLFQSMPRTRSDMLFLKRPMKTCKSKLQESWTTPKSLLVLNRRLKQGNKLPLPASFIKLKVPHPREWLTIELEQILTNSIRMILKGQLPRRRHSWWVVGPNHWLLARDQLQRAERLQMRDWRNISNSVETLAWNLLKRKHSTVQHSLKSKKNQRAWPASLVKRPRMILRHSKGGPTQVVRRTTLAPPSPASWTTPSESITKTFYRTEYRQRTSTFVSARAMVKLWVMNGNRSARFDA